MSITIWVTIFVSFYVVFLLPAIQREKERQEHNK